MSTKEELTYYKQAFRELRIRTEFSENRVADLETSIKAINTKICFTNRIPNHIKNDLLKLCRI